MKYIVSLLFLIGSFYADAQIGPSHLNIKLIPGFDSTSLAVTKNGRIRYDSTSQKFRFRQDGAWVGLGEGGGGGGGTLTSVGLTLGTSGTDAGVSGSPLTSDGSITLNLPSSSASNRGLLTSTDWSTFNGKQATLVSGTNIKTVNGTTALGSGDIDLIDDAIVNGEAKAPSQNATFDALALKYNVTYSTTALTDASSIDLTSTLHTLTSSSATRTFTISYTGNNITILLTLNAAGATYTFPSGSLCIYNGQPSGDNTMVVSGESGDKYVIQIKVVGSEFIVIGKNLER